MFVLGTAQFGMDYGGSGGKLSVQHLQEILRLSEKYKIGTIDTASDYGVSETLLGRCNLSKFNVNTKLPSKLPMSKCSLFDVFGESLIKLNIKKVNVLFIHNSHNFLRHPHNESLFESLLTLKQNGDIKGIGLSVYDASEIVNCQNRGFDFDIVQAPFNFYDSRLYTYAQTENCNFDVQYRSIFLQGLLVDLSRREKFFSSEVFREFEQAFQKSLIGSRLKYCLDYAQHFVRLKNCVVGVRKIDDLKVLGDLINQKSQAKPKLNLYNEDKFKLVNPYLWENI